ncbi:MAG: ribonuclease III [Myxococcota bacterium]
MELATLSALQTRLGYRFGQVGLLVRALTHRSFAKELKKKKKIPNNETLEFLGDAVLSLVVAQQAYMHNPDADEGALSRLRAAYVCQDNLVAAARQLDLGSWVRVSGQMRSAGGVRLPTVLSDALEAVIGAVYLDGGLSAARRVILHVFGSVPTASDSLPAKDPKTNLQELLQRVCRQVPLYQTTRAGPEHAPYFAAVVVLGAFPLGRGEGASKRRAQQQAAQSALRQLSGLDDQALSTFVRDALSKEHAH